MKLTKTEKRKFLRHPIRVPIRLEIEPPNGYTSGSEVADLSQGGLSFLWEKRLAKGQGIHITIPVKEKQFRVSAQVAYSERDPKSGSFRTGACFTDAESAFRAKLAEETLEILLYRRRRAKELGHDVSEEEAAREWIARHIKSSL